MSEPVTIRQAVAAYENFLNRGGSFEDGNVMSAFFDQYHALEADLESANIRATNANTRNLTLQTQLAEAIKERDLRNSQRNTLMREIAGAQAAGAERDDYMAGLREIDQHLADGLNTQVVTVADYRRVIEGFWDWLVAYRADALEALRKEQP